MLSYFSQYQSSGLSDRLTIEPHIALNLMVSCVCDAESQEDETREQSQMGSGKVKTKISKVSFLCG